ncbi:type II secretion system F family protein [Paludicola sp. MB14-C6]|uniref:type II secretion system F family protein n=1 Tax=Paludihabitans sp. MB14-C6 TaxID=3070656 RepID=UPI0027DB1CD3|nr:type II secretion system F family protein [Paludicola sp. MB14-C6]WMJ22321.1 type II secretion system F family protein [Paludicola sp. MB14-C6]
MDTQTKERKMRLLSSDDISIFCAQVALILKSGIPLHEGIVAISENIEEKNAKKLIIEISNSVEAKGELHIALSESGVFPDYMVNMVRIGEKTGKLEPVMESLSYYYEREAELKNRVRSAILYPTILVLMMCAVLTVLIVKVLPIFSDVFASLGSDMPAMAAQMMNFGLSLGKYAYVILLLLAILIVGLFYYSKTSKGTHNISKLFGQLFFTKKLTAKVAAARFASVMSMMFSSGYHTDEALELASLIVNHSTVKQKVEKCRDLINKGYSFSDSVTQTGIFGGIYGRMVSIGVKTGSLDEVMKRLADIYNDQADESVDKAVALVEPILVGILCVVIGIILLTVMLPLMGIMSSIG